MTEDTDHTLIPEDRLLSLDFFRGITLDPSGKQVTHYAEFSENDSIENQTEDLSNPKRVVDLLTDDEVNIDI